MIELLLEFPFDPTIEDSNGMLAHEIADDRGLQPTFEKLYQYYINYNYMKWINSYANGNTHPIHCNTPFFESNNINLDANMATCGVQQDDNKDDKNKLTFQISRININNCVDNKKQNFNPNSVTNINDDCVSQSWHCQQSESDKSVLSGDVSDIGAHARTICPSVTESDDD